VNGYIVICSTISIAVFLFYIFSVKIINPVKKISETMLEIASGNLEINLEDHSYNENDKNTELGKMEASLRIFMKNEIKRREAEEEIRKLALTDPLTGLANRNQFEIKYLEMAALAKREEKSLYLLAIDLDDFKPVNDEYGHAAGDMILQSVAQKLLLTFRETDLIARLGGDEFSVVLYGAEEISGVVKAAERLLTLIPSPVPFGKDMLSVGVSIGIAQHGYEEGDDLNMLMQNADKALYEAKNSGKNTYSIYSQD
jgi:diguanylate cyclase (GGDEF)-like protein